MVQLKKYGEKFDIFDKNFINLNKVKPEMLKILIRKELLSSEKKNEVRFRFLFSKKFSKQYLLKALETIETALFDFGSFNKFVFFYAEYYSLEKDKTKVVGPYMNFAKCWKISENRKTWFLKYESELLQLELPLNSWDCYDLNFDDLDQSYEYDELHDRVVCEIITKLHYPN